jgi:hypothetical protein
MSDVFAETLRPWTYTALVAEVLRTTKLPLPPRTASNSLPLSETVLAFAKPRHDAAYWEKAIGGQNLKVEDKLDSKRFNQALWRGLMGEETPYPEMRHGRDLSHDWQRLLEEYRESVLRSAASQAGKISTQ